MEIYDNIEQCQISQIDESIAFEEAIKSKEWCPARDEEMKALEGNKTWELFDIPDEKEVVGLKWIYKIDYQDDGYVKKYKARIVACEYM